MKMHIGTLCMVALALSCSKHLEKVEEGSEQVGHASWYGSKFHGRRTASGEIYDMHAFTAAHRTAPFHIRVRVTNLENGKKTTVRITDRGPFVKGRLIDLSYAAAKDIGLVAKGTAKVRLEFLEKVAVRGRFFVQVGSFSSSQNASQLASELKRRFPNKKTKIDHSTSHFRVWVGPVGTQGKAASMAEKLRNSGYSAFRDQELALFY